MCNVTTNAKDVRPVQIENLAGLVGVKRELPTSPESVIMFNTSFVSKLYDSFDNNSQKAFTPKKCIDRKEYDSGMMESPQNKGDVADNKECEMTFEKQLTKRHRIFFDDDSDSGYSD